MFDEPEIEDAKVTWHLGVTEDEVSLGIAC